MSKNNIIITAVIAVVVAAGSFFGGYKYSQSKTSARTGVRNSAGQFNGANAGTRGSFRPVVGDVLSADASSLTVKQTDGSSRVVILSTTTQISQAASASASDIKIGGQVAVYGTMNTDGSVTAQSVQINPIISGNSGMMGR